MAEYIESAVSAEKKIKIQRPWQATVYRWLVRIILYAWVLTIIFPIYWMLATAIKDNAEFAKNLWGWTDTIFIINFMDAWREAQMSRYILNTLEVVGMTLVIYLFFVTTTAYAIAKLSCRFTRFLKSFYFFSMMIPGILLLYQLYFQLYDISESLPSSLFVLALVYAVQGMPTPVFLLTGFMQGIDKSFMEAAKIDGANEWTIFLRVAIPFVLPMVLFLGLTQFMGTWNEYLTAVTFLSTGKSLTLSVGIQRVIDTYQRQSNYGVIFASLLISLAPILILYTCFQKIIQNGTDMSEGLK